MSGLRLGLLILGSIALGGCETKPSVAKPEPKVAEQTPGTSEPDEVELRVLGPSEFETLEVLHFPEPLGEGYERVEVELGAPLYQGKWLRLANGDSRLLAERHLIVTEYAERPRYPVREPELGSVILDVDSGEVVARFRDRLDVHWDHGFALVRAAGEPGPLLFTPETAKLVPALPAGEHGYVYGENYWLRISPIAPRVWIIAEAPDGQAHLYEWEDLGQSPPLPANPVAFIPSRWYPEASRSLVEVDHEEVWRPGDLGCEQAILEPPRGFRCLDETELADSLPVGDGWRFDRSEALVFEDPKRPISLAKVCPEGDLDMQVFYDSMLRLRCLGDESVWGLWSAPDRVRLVDEQWARDLNAAVRSLYPYKKLDLYELLERRPSAVHSVFDGETSERVLVGKDYECSTRSVRGTGQIYGIGCPSKGWIDIVDKTAKTRARASASDMAVGQSGKVALVKQRGAHCEVVVAQ